MSITPCLLKRTILYSAQQALPGSFQAVDHPGQVLFGFKSLTKGPDVEVSLLAAANGIAILPQMIHHLMQPGFADAQDVPESPARYCVLPTGTRTF